MGILKAIYAILVVVKCLLQLLLGVHDKWSMLRNRLTKGLASNKNKLSSFFGLKSIFVQDTAMKSIYQLLAFILDLPFVDKDNGVPNARNGKLENTSRQYVDIEVVRWSSGIDGACFTFPLSRNDLHFDLVLLENLYLVVGILLVGRLDHLILAFQVNPQLEAERIFFVGGRDF